MKPNQVRVWRSVSLRFVVLLCACLWAFSCGDSPPPGEDPPEDIADTALDTHATDVGLETELTDVGGQVGFPAPKSVLLVDFDMRPLGAWDRTVGAFEAQGYTVDYRRWYPHLSTSDVEANANSGQYPYRIVVVAAGGGLPHATSRMTQVDGEHLTSFLKAGGHAVWAPSNGWSDRILGEAEWVLGNRLLETLGIGVRIERNTVIGNVVLADPGKPPLHTQNSSYYPGTLEWTLDLPVIFGAAGHSAIGNDLGGVAGGYLPTISCDDEQVSVLARVPWQSILWWHHMLTDDQLSYASGQEPVSVMARVPEGGGFLTVVPGGFLTLEDGSGRSADQPLLDPDMLANATLLGGRILTEVAHRAEQVDGFTAGGCSAGTLPLFSAAAPGLPAMGQGTVAMANQAVNAGVVNPTPPEPPPWSPPLLTQRTPEEGVETVIPTWFENGKARIGYAELQSATDTEETLSQWTSLGVNAFVMVTNTALLSSYDGTGFMEEQSAVLSVKAIETNAHVFLGVHYIDPYGASKAALGSALDPTGFAIQAPPPLSDTWWDGPIRDMFMGAAAIQSAHPGIAGISLDLELYGAASLWYRNGHAFDADAWGVILSALAGHDATLATEAESLAIAERYSWLIGQGLWGFAVQALEDAVALKAAAVLAEARGVAPALEVALYALTASPSWFYRGMIRGLGSAAQPVVLLTYDMSTARTRHWWNEEGLHAMLVSGFIGTLFSPEDVGAGLVHCAHGSDGYWLFQLKDFPNTESPDVLAKMHAPSSEYYDAVKAANQTLDAVEP